MLNTNITHNFFHSHQTALRVKELSKDPFIKLYNLGYQTNTVTVTLLFAMINFTWRPPLPC